MITIKVNDSTMKINEGTKVIDLLKEEDKKKYLLCKINGQVKELNYRLQERNDNATISFHGLETIEGGKIYETTIRYIIAMAFHNLYPTIKIRFSYYVSRSVFCEVLTPNVSLSKLYKNIENEIKRIIANDMPIERIVVTNEEAKKIYVRENLSDKLDILEYRPEKDVHLYKCSDYYNYLHNYMAPSTGYVSNFIMRPYSPGIIIQYPRYELDARIPYFDEESTYGRTLRKAYNWAKKVNCQTIYAINKRIENENITDFINICETKHTNMLAELGQKICDDIENVRLIAIAGPSSSGKTTFSNRLRIELMSHGINPVTISMDDYYFTREEIAKIQGVPADQVDLEHINTLDTELFNQHLFDLINGDEIHLPKFDFTTGKRVEGKSLKVDQHSPIIIEGIHALNEKLTSSIPKYQKFKIFISPQAQINIDNHTPMSTTDLRLIRRIVRDKQFRNCPAAETIAMWDSVRSGEFKWIYPFQEGADFVYNSELTYELCVLKKYALPALREIPISSPEYLTANRLIKYLKYYKTIDDESAIPCNSLIREFIGGSCFNVQ